MDDDALPSKEEKALVDELRASFKDEFSKREAEGRNYPCLFGELALVRVLRGNERKLEAAKKWFSNFLLKAERFGVDDIVSEMTAKLNESGSPYATLEMLPFHEEIHKFFRIIVTAPTLTPRGDVIQYVPVVDFDKRGIFDELNWDHWVRFWRALMILRCIECELLSRSQGRVVKCITILDIHDCPWDSIFYKPFDRDMEEDVNSFIKEVCAEIMGKVYVVNPSLKLATLGTLISKFAPEKFAQKVKIQTGDVLKDKEFITLVGGKAQLESFFDSREGITLSRTYEEQPREAIESDKFPTDQELEIIGLLRAEFRNELETRAAENRDYPCFFDDIALTRLLRGSGGSHNAARKWMKRFFDKMLEFKVDDMMPDLIRRFEESGYRLCLEILPYYDELKPFLRFTPCAQSCSPKGDVIQYLALVDVDRAKILSEVEWDHWVSFMRSLTLIRCLFLSRASHAQGRIVKAICIWDLNDCSLGSLRMPEFMERHQKDCSAFMHNLCIETMGQQYVVNAPWVVVRLINLFGSLLPEKFMRKMTIMNDDGASDPTFVEEIGGKIQLKQLLASRVGLVEGSEQPNGDQYIAAGQTFERFYDAAAGQRIEWSFELIAGSADYFLGTSDIDFSITLYELPDALEQARPVPEEDKPGVDIVEVTRVSTGDGEQSGSCDILTGGFIMIRWSNMHSTIRAKSLRYSVSVVDGKFKKTAEFPIAEEIGQAIVKPLDEEDDVKDVVEKD